MLKRIALITLACTQLSAMASVSGFSLPRLDFDMAETAIKKSAAMKSLTTTMGTEVISADKVAKRTFLVSLDNGCTVVATFGKFSKVSVNNSSLDCGGK